MIMHRILTQNTANLPKEPLSRKVIWLLASTIHYVHLLNNMRPQPLKEDMGEALGLMRRTNVYQGDDEDQEEIRNEGDHPG